MTVKGEYEEQLLIAAINFFLQQMVLLLLRSLLQLTFITLLL